MLTGLSQAILGYPNADWLSLSTTGKCKC
uniref:Uncharacterized protein n=1 Tax=Anguilla anguilla TaxID=7936 RepID=A0A0E9XRZ5_ANGAN